MGFRCFRWGQTAEGTGHRYRGNTFCGMIRDQGESFRNTLVLYYNVWNAPKVHRAT